MSFFDRFLSAMKLNDDDDFDDDEYLDEDDGADEDAAPKRRIIPRRDDTDDDLDDDGADARSPRRTVSPIRSRSQSASQKPARSQTYSSAKVSTFHPRRDSDSDTLQGSNVSVCVIRPRSMEDSREITRTLLMGSTVIILNLEGLELEVSQRIFDFSLGACCAIRGRLEKISNYIFILTPENVDVSGEFQEIISEAFNLDDGDEY